MLITTLNLNFLRSVVHKLLEFFCLYSLGCLVPPIFFSSPLGLPEENTRSLPALNFFFFFFANRSLSAPLIPFHGLNFQ